MNKTLSQIRAEARKKFNDIVRVPRPFPEWDMTDAQKLAFQQHENKAAFLEELLDSLIDATFLAIKEGVVPKEETDLERYESSHTVRTFKIGYNRCRSEVLRNFDAMEGNEKSV